MKVMDEYHDYYVTAAMNEGHQRQRLIRAETKLQQRLIWRRGWRLDAERNVNLWPSWPIQPIHVHLGQLVGNLLMHRLFRWLRPVATF